MPNLREKEMKCLRCGKCCTTCGLMKQSTLFEKIVFRIVMVKRVGWLGLKNPQCPHLRFRKRNAYCAIYDKRPDFCREYYCEKSKKNK